VRGSLDPVGLAGMDARLKWIETMFLLTLVCNILSCSFPPLCSLHVKAAALSNDNEKYKSTSHTSSISVRSTKHPAHVKDLRSACNFGDLAEDQASLVDHCCMCQKRITMDAQSAA
jgi:hypothetical protein